MMPLKYVAFHITYVCDNKCPYCYVGNGKRDTHPLFSDAKKVIERLSEDGVETILLVGGDPSTYPQLREVVELINEKGMKVCILSNTLEFGKEQGTFLDKISSFQTTILGASEKEHDSEAGKKGAYKKIINNIRRLNKNGKKVTVCLSLHKQNYDKILGIVENLVEKENLDIEEIVIQRIIPQGRAQKSLTFSLTKKQTQKVFEQLHKVKKSLKIKIDFEDVFPLCIIDEKHRYLQKHPCEWGFSKASINFKGDLGRCGADGRFLLGNIFKIKDLQKFWKESPVLVDFRKRKWLPQKCQRCVLLERCGGGCSLSRITCKDHAPDILCEC